MNNSGSRFFWGGLIVLMGFVLLLNQFGIGYGLAKIWPLIVVFLGIYLVIKNPINIIPGLFMLTVGIFLQLDALNVLPFSVWNLWPLFIIFAGISVLLGKRDRLSSSTEHGFITSNVLFWGDEKNVKGEFTGAKVHATFGGVKLDLRDAEIKGNVKIEVDLIFAGLEILLPDNVKLVNNIFGMMGGLSDNRRTNSDSENVIEISGSAVFGGVDLK